MLVDPAGQDRFLETLRREVELLNEIFPVRMDGANPKREQAMTGAAETGTVTTSTETTSTETTDTDDGHKAEVDWKAKAREWERRAKANATAATRLEELENAQKTEAQKAADARAAAERERDEARADALRWRVAAKHGISDEDAELFLTGTDEDTLTKQATRLTERTSERKKNGNVVPNEGRTPSTQANDVRDFTRQLFASD